MSDKAKRVGATSLEFLEIQTPIKRQLSPKPDMIQKQMNTLFLMILTLAVKWKGH